jgi:hypothetical protein
MSHRAFDGYTAPQTANGIDGYRTVIRAQSATGTGANGGDLVLASGKGTNRDGYVRIGADGYDVLIVTSSGIVTNTSEITFDRNQIAPTIRQLDMPTDGYDGYHLTIKAQKSAANPAHGGNLILQGGDGYNGDGYFRDGYVRLLSGSTEQARVVPNKFSMLTGQRIKLTHINSGTDGYVLENDYLIMVNTSVSRQIYLPPNPIEGDVYQIKDKTGSANPNTITINGNGHNIDGNATYLINTNYASALFVYSGTQWGVL